MVKKYWLIFTNGLLWSLAGYNIVRIGIKAAVADGRAVWLWCWLVFSAFGAMFTRMVGKNSRRILAMEGSRAWLHRFLTLKGYLIIAFMMTLGIALRRFSTLPDAFFAFFYTGLGSALALAGILFLMKGLRLHIIEIYEREN